MEMLRDNVRKKTGRLTGLLIRPEYAQQFFTCGKTLEIRSKPIKFLERGDGVVLVSSGKGSNRVCLGILRFIQSLKIEDCDFSRYYDCHKLSEEDYKCLKAGWKKADQESCFAWHFEPVHCFDEPLHFNRRFIGTEVWMYFDLSCLCLRKQPSEQTRGDQGATLEDVSPHPQPAEPGSETQASRDWPPVHWANHYLTSVGLNHDTFTKPLDEPIVTHLDFDSNCNTQWSSDKETKQNSSNISHCAIR